MPVLLPFSLWSVTLVLPLTSSSLLLLMFTHSGVHCIINNANFGMWLVRRAAELMTQSRQLSQAAGRPALKVQQYSSLMVMKERIVSCTLQPFLLAAYPYSTTSPAQLFTQYLPLALS